MRMQVGPLLYDEHTDVIILTIYLRIFHALVIIYNEDDGAWVRQLHHQVANGRVKGDKEQFLVLWYAVISKHDGNYLLKISREKYQLPLTRNIVTSS